MQQRQATNTDNNYFNLVSALYHALEEQQTSAAYIQDAQQSGNQQLVQFFQQLQQDSARQADQAKQLLSQMSK